MKNKKNPKKVYPYKKNNKKIINIPSNIEQLFFESGDIEKESIHIYRALAVLLARIKGEEIKDRGQYILFSEEFLMDDLEEKDNYVGFHFKKSDFLPKGYTNFKPVEDALNYLRKFKIDEKVKFTRADGKILSYYTHFIGTFAFEEDGKGGVYLEVGSYWYFRLKYGMKGFNKYLFYLFFKTSSVRTLRFFSYLLKFNDTSILTLKSFNEKFKTNYLYYSDAEREFLEPLRKELNTIAPITFGYYKDDNDNIVLKKLVRKKLIGKRENNIPESEQNKTEALKKYLNKLNYLKRKHELEEKEIELIKSAFTKYKYESLIEICKIYKKQLSSDLKGEYFTKKFVECYTDYIKNKNSE